MRLELGKMGALNNETEKFRFLNVISKKRKDDLRVKKFESRRQNCPKSKYSSAGTTLVNKVKQNKNISPLIAHIYI